MIRTKRWSIARKWRTKSKPSFHGARSNRTLTILQQRRKALVSSQRDRDRKKKKDFRSTWVNRINEIIGQNKEKFYYSNLMYNLYKNQLLLNCKIISEIAILKGNCLFIISNDIIFLIKILRRLNPGKVVE